MGTDSKQNKHWHKNQELEKEESGNVEKRKKCTKIMDLKGRKRKGTMWRMDTKRRCAKLWQMVIMFKTWWRGFWTKCGEEKKNVHKELATWKEESAIHVKDDEHKEKTSAKPMMVMMMFETWRRKGVWKFGKEMKRSQRACTWKEASVHIHMKDGHKEEMCQQNHCCWWEKLGGKR